MLKSLQIRFIRLVCAGCCHIRVCLLFWLILPHMGHALAIRPGAGMVWITLDIMLYMLTSCGIKRCREEKGGSFVWSGVGFTEIHTK
jgi:hypothetical protein